MPICGVCRARLRAISLRVLIFPDGAEGEVVQCVLVAAEENLPFLQYQYPTADVKRELLVDMDIETEFRQVIELLLR